MMGLIEVEIIDDDTNKRYERRSNLKFLNPDEIRNWCETGFLRKSGIIYCKECGKENLKDSVSYGRGCIVCGESDFIDEYTSGVVSGYLELARKKNLGKYYNKIMKKRGSNIKMNEKRMMHHLLLHKDRLDIDKDIVDKIYRKNHV